MPHHHLANEVARIKGELAVLAAKQAELQQEAEALQSQLTTDSGRAAHLPPDAAALANRLAAVERVLETVSEWIGEKQAELAYAQAAARRHHIAELREQEWEAAEAFYRTIDLALVRLQHLQALQTQLAALDEPPEDDVPSALFPALEATHKGARRQRRQRPWAPGAA